MKIRFLKSSKYFSGQKRAQDGSLLRFKSLELTNVLSERIFNDIKTMELFNILENQFHSKKLELYFKKYFFYRFKDLVSAIVLIEWYQRKYPNSNKFTYLPNYYWIDFLTKFDDHGKVIGDHQITDLLIKHWPSEKIRCRIPISAKIISFMKVIYFKIRDNYYSVRNYFIILIKGWIKESHNSIPDFITKNELNRRELHLNEVQVPSITITFTEGINTAKRSDIFWYSNSGVDPSSILIYFRNEDWFNRYGKPKILINELENYGFKWLTLFNNKINVKRTWKSNGAIKLNFVEDLKAEINKIKVKNKSDAWLKNEINNLLDAVTYWIKFFSTTNTKIFYDIDELYLHTISKSLALDCIGGCSFGKLRSYITQGKGLFYGYYPNEIFFVWGKDSAKRYLKTENIHHNIIITGYPYENSNDINPEKKNISEYLKKNGAQFIVCIFDNIHNMNPNLEQVVHSSIMEKFYKSLLLWAKVDEEIGLIIKSKHPDHNMILPGVPALIEELNGTGRLYEVRDSHGVRPCDFSKYSTIAVSINLFLSSALIESVLKGIRGVHYDYGNLMKNEHELYSWGFNQVIFNDLDKMIESLKRYKNDPSSNPNLGNWSKHLDEIDPFRDGKGGERIGKYLFWLQDGYEKGLERNDSITRANELYANKWGEDKIYFCDK